MPTPLSLLKIGSMVAILRVPTQRGYGELIQIGERTAVRLFPKEGAPSLYFRLALTEMGTDRPLFPALLLDDWGNEKRGLSLYSWLRREGPHYPRAELFGFDDSWRETQFFVRELELFALYPCFAYPDTKTPPPLEEGARIFAIGVTDESAREPVAITDREGMAALRQLPGYDYLTPPLTQAQVRWWLLPPNVPFPAN